MCNIKVRLNCEFSLDVVFISCPYYRNCFMLPQTEGQKSWQLFTLRSFNHLIYGGYIVLSESLCSSWQTELLNSSFLRSSCRRKSAVTFQTLQEIWCQFLFSNNCDVWSEGVYYITYYIFMRCIQTTTWLYFYVYFVCRQILFFPLLSMLSP